MSDLWVIGGGFAGCEASWILANHGYKVKLYEMKPNKYSPAHKNPNLCELVCSNSFKAYRHTSASGLLKEEMELCGSLCIECAKATSVPSGGALAVDREKFSDLVTQKIVSNPNIEVINEEVKDIPDGYGIVATGPLTSENLCKSLSTLLGEKFLNFFDASAPIVSADSINYNRVYYATRYDRGDADYLNCSFDKEEYEEFYNALINAESVELKDFEKDFFKVYEGCMPIEVMAKRGPDTLRFGPMRPVGLKDPRTGHRPWANIQLRKENESGSMFNIVGFQTNLKFPEQKRVFSLIPGLENAEFLRYGVMHMNTFIDSPRLLDNCFRFINNKRIYFAGQLTGVEGYMESAASGIVAGYSMLKTLRNEEPIPFPVETMIGSLSRYISNTEINNFQPMGANMGILPETESRIRNKEERYTYLSDRSIKVLKKFLNNGD